MHPNLNFTSKSYEEVAESISTDPEYKCLLESLQKIQLLDKVDLKDSGSNDDLDNFQIFTPEFIVRDMIDAVGKDKVTDSANRILEPTSGDGAFTVRILQMRLAKIKERDRDSLIRGVFESLGTVYSIEMDENLVKAQRNNIYTTAIKFLKRKKIELTESEDLVLRLMINENVIWGETNSDPKAIFSEIDCEMAHYMPCEDKNNKIPVEFPVWSFLERSVNLHYELPELGD